MLIAIKLLNNVIKITSLILSGWCQRDQVDRAAKEATNWKGEGVWLNSILVYSILKHYYIRLMLASYSTMMYSDWYLDLFCFALLILKLKCNCMYKWLEWIILTSLALLHFHFTLLNLFSLDWKDNKWIGLWVWHWSHILKHAISILNLFYTFSNPSFDFWTLLTYWRPKSQTPRTEI